MSREYTALPFLNIGKHHGLGLFWCRVWYVGYQLYPDGCGGWDLMIMLIPFIAINIRFRWFK